MKKLTFVIMLDLMVSTMFAFDVCAGDFFDRYEKRLELAIELLERRQHAACNQLSSIGSMIYANKYGADGFYKKYSKLCGSNAKMKMRKIYFDDLLKQAENTYKFYYKGNGCENAD